MTRLTRLFWVRPVALSCLGLLLLVLGAALRPVAIGDSAAAAPVLDEVEIAFVQDMIAHHQQALILVQRLDPAADPAVLALARQIDDTQRTELGMLLGWLRLAGAGLTNPHPMAWMRDPAARADHRHGSAAAPSTTQTAGEHVMPGMATSAELDALAAAHGRDAGVLFLHLMQRHHYGGVSMARALDRQLDGGVVKQAARDMITDQSQEAGMMGLLLARNGTATALGESAPR